MRDNPVAALAKRLNVATVATNYDSMTLYDDDGTALDDTQRRAAEQRFRALMRAVDALREESDGDASLASAIARVRDQVAMNTKQQHMLDISINTMVEHEYAAAELEPKGDAEVVGEAMSVLQRLYGDAIRLPSSR